MAKAGTKKNAGRGPAKKAGRKPHPVKTKLQVKGKGKGKIKSAGRTAAGSAKNKKQQAKKKPRGTAAVRRKPTRDAAAEAREKLQHTLEDDNEEDEEDEEDEELENDSPGTKSADAAIPDEHDAKEASVQKPPRQTFRIRRGSGAAAAAAAAGAGTVATNFGAGSSAGQVAGASGESAVSLLPACYTGEGAAARDQANDQRVLRAQGLEYCLSIIKTCAEEVVAEASRPCITAVSRFINGWRFGAGRDERGDHGKSDLIPLAVVESGLHLGDRAWAVEHIRRGLVGTKPTNCSQVVVVLRCHDCSSVQAALAAIHNQCLLLGGVKSQRPLFMDALEAWYNSLFPTNGTSSSRASSGTLSSSSSSSFSSSSSWKKTYSGVSGRRGRSYRPPVVVVLEDVEGMNKQVLKGVLAVLAQTPSSRPPTSTAPTATISPLPTSAGQPPASRQGPQPPAAAAEAKLAKARQSLVAKGVLGKSTGTAGERGGDTRFRGGAPATTTGRGGGRSGRGFPLALVALASGGVGFPLDRLSPGARNVSIQSFPLPFAEDLADDLFRKLFIEGRLPVAMGAKVVGWMQKSFYTSHNSITTLSREIQRAVYEHFKLPSSYLCLYACTPWLNRMNYQGRAHDTTTWFGPKLALDVRYMTPAQRSALGVPSQQQRVSATRHAYSLIQQALARQTSAALRLWFFHKVLSTLANSEGVRRARGLSLDASPRKLVELVANGRRSRSYYVQITEAAAGLSALSPLEINVLLRHLLQALPLPSTTNQASASVASANSEAATASALMQAANQGIGAAAAPTSTEASTGPSPSTYRDETPLAVVDKGHGTQAAAATISAAANQTTTPAVLTNEKGTQDSAAKSSNQATSSVALSADDETIQAPVLSADHTATPGTLGSDKPTAMATPAGSPVPTPTTRSTNADAREIPAVDQTTASTTASANDEETGTSAVDETADTVATAASTNNAPSAESAANTHDHRFNLQEAADQRASPDGCSSDQPSRVLENAGRAEVGVPNVEQGKVDESSQGNLREDCSITATERLKNTRDAKSCSERAEDDAMDIDRAAGTSTAPAAASAAATAPAAGDADITISGHKRSVDAVYEQENPSASDVFVSNTEATTAQNKHAKDDASLVGKAAGSAAPALQDSREGWEGQDSAGVGRSCWDRASYDRIPGMIAPPALAVLDPREADYLGSSAAKLLHLWKVAEEEGWAEAVNSEDMLSLVDNRDTDGSSREIATSTWMSAASPKAGGSGNGSGGGGASKSRGSRLLNRALHETSASAQGDTVSGGTGPGGDSSGSCAKGGAADDVAARSSGSGVPDEAPEPSDGRALQRACLMREVQLLFLHVMGEARDCPLNSIPGTPLPPPQPNNASVLLGAYRFDEVKDLQRSLAPHTRAHVDAAMMKGAGMDSISGGKAGSTLYSDTCLLYSCYRGHGKVMSRADWYNDFVEALDHNARAMTSATTTATSSESNRPAGRVTETIEGTRKKDVPEHKATPAELRARFRHASSELAFLGFVRPYKRKRKQDEGLRGPKGAMERLVFAYSMQSGM